MRRDKSHSGAFTNQLVFNIKFTLSGGGGLGRDIWHMIESHCIHSEELLLLALLLVLLAILNDLPGLTSCRRDKIGLVSLILLIGLGITCLISLYYACVQGILILSLLIFIYAIRIFPF